MESTFSIKTTKLVDGLPEGDTVIITSSKNTLDDAIKNCNDDIIAASLLETGTYQVELIRDATGETEDLKDIEI